MRRPSPHRFSLLPMILTTIVGMPLLLHGISMAGEENTELGDRSSRSLVKRSSSGAQSRQASVEAKLERILSNQRTILQKQQAVKEEVQIIQVRNSSRGAVRPCP